jgi:hypothetical protein
MSKETEMKHEVLEMLKNFMLGEQGKKIKPKAIEVEMIAEKPKSKAGLDDVLEEASKEPMEEKESKEDDKKRSMKEFFARK